jgi:hypothetical protein
MNFIFKIKDKSGKDIHLSAERWKHIKNHPHMDENKLEDIKATIQNPMAIRYNEDDEEVRCFYREYKNMLPSEKYLLVSVKYLNGNGFVITSFFTNKITGLKWETK